MKMPKSKVGWMLAGAYLLLSILLIGTQGLFGESFIAILLGIPWTFLLAYFEYFAVSGVMIYVMVLGPIALNALLLYWIGSWFEFGDKSSAALSRKLLILGIIVVLVAAGYAALRHSAQRSGTKVAPEVETVIDFVQIGTVAFDADVPQLQYEEAGAAATKTLAWDEYSVCVDQLEATPCVIMSTTLNEFLNGQRVTVEGVAQEGEVVLVRKLRKLEEGESPLLPATGQTFIPWAYAMLHIESCEVAMVVQAHSLSVALKLKDGRQLVAVEPAIDRVFDVVQQAQPRCGDVIIATE